MYIEVKCCRYCKVGWYSCRSEESQAKSVYSLFSRPTFVCFVFFYWKNVICILLVLMSCCCASLDMKAGNQDDLCFPDDANSSGKVTTSAGCRLFPETTLQKHRISRHLYRKKCS